MSCFTKAYDVGTSWVLVGQNCSEIYIAANKQYDIDLYIGNTAPSATTRDFIPIESMDNFGASSLVSGTDVVYIRCSSQSTITVKVLTL